MMHDGLDAIARRSAVSFFPAAGSLVGGISRRLGEKVEGLDRPATIDSLLGRERGQRRSQQHS
jgi:hypothetical protein